MSAVMCHRVRRRDAPAEPLSTKNRVVLFAVLAAAVVIAIVVVLITL
jgi:hypothetical protein